MNRRRSGEGGAGSGSELSEDQLKAELLARLGQLSYLELLTLTLDMALGSRATVGARGSRPRSVMQRVRPAVGEVVDWTKVKATCPRCGKTGRVQPDFGTARRRNGTVRPQSHCRACRKQGTPTPKP